MMPLPPHRRQPGLPEGQAGFTLGLAPESPVFLGHFPGDPVLPGVIQVDWAIRFGEACFGPLGAFMGLEQLKFLEPVRPGPGLALALALDRSGPGPRLRFSYQVDSGRKSSGTILFTHFL
jgi:3-hydroxymyristoyl/3-hydroxydecanoyl-(acyl carrier protein) dehydratase